MPKVLKKFKKIKKGYIFVLTNIFKYSGSLTSNKLVLLSV